MAGQSGRYEAVLAGQRPEGRLYRNDELTTLAFAAHRYSSALAAQQALDAERERLGAQFNAHSLTQRGLGYVLVAEISALCSRWNQPLAHLSAPAALISSTIRRAYWMWLEDDDPGDGSPAVHLRADGHTAGLAPQAHQGRAALNERASTMPKDWLQAAGWKRLAALNRGLSEYAHSYEGSRWDGARQLFAALHVEPGEDALFKARGSALDFVTSLAAREVIRVIGAQQSTELATAFVDMLAKSHITVDLDDTSLNSVLDHIWVHRQTTLGPEAIRWS